MVQWWRHPASVAMQMEPTAEPVRQVHAVHVEGLDALAERLGASGWLSQSGFRPVAGALALVPGEGGVAAAILCLGAAAAPRGAPGALYGLLPGGLPQGVWEVVWEAPESRDEAGLACGFCLGAYHFDAYVPPRRPPARLLATEAMAGGIARAQAAWIARDLINRPANHLGPAELAQSAVSLGRVLGAEAEIISGEALAQAYPAIAAVGAGSDRPPAVAILRWAPPEGGDELPLVSLVGKGVCFDTGGYDLKPSAAMLRMKKDMGGAAIMLGVAALLIAQGAPCRIELRLGCVENSVSGHAMRPSDVLATRRGLSVEIGNTDAEGRLVLCDLLAEASDLSPDWLIDAATLTGAARVALGPDLPALFGNDDTLAEALLAAGHECGDPVWRLPLWPGYDDWLSSRVADINNASSKPMAGAITAALYLNRFVAESVSWAHLDTYAWSDSTRPGHPEGGDCQGLFALAGGILRLVNARVRTLMAERE